MNRKNIIYSENKAEQSSEKSNNIDEKAAYKSLFQIFAIMLLASGLGVFFSVKYEMWELFEFAFTGVYTSFILLLVYFIDYKNPFMNFRAIKDNAIGQAIYFLAIVFIVVSGFNNAHNTITAGFDSASEDETKLIIGGGEYRGEPAKMDSTSNKIR